jgi:hypothetical protein
VTTLDLGPTVVLPTALPVAQAHLAELRAEAERDRLARMARRPAKRASWLAGLLAALRDADTLAQANQTASAGACCPA